MIDKTFLFQIFVIVESSENRSGVMMEPCRERTIIFEFIKWSKERIYTIITITSSAVMSSDINEDLIIKQLTQQLNANESRRFYDMLSTFNESHLFINTSQDEVN